tara:strand:- start:824 stop:1441 length:618 start_codon:yes stop_codon:yes gene_type:complete
MAVVNKHIVNSTGKGANAFSETFHGLRRTTEGLLYYNLRDKNVGTFSNDGGTTELENDNDYVAVEEEYLSGDETFTGDASTTAFTIGTTGLFADRLAVFINRVRQTATTDYTLSGTTLTFVRAPHNNAEIFVRKIKREYKNETTDTFQQYRFENGKAHYKINDAKLVRVENKRIPNNTSYFPFEVEDNFTTIESSYPTASTTYRA